MAISRIPRVNVKNLDAKGKCDITGLPVMHADLVKQYEYIGNQLTWNGLMVHYAYADKPNPQLISLKLPPNPIPVSNPRFFDQVQAPSVPSGMVVVNVTSDSISLSWNPVFLATNYAVAWVTPSGFYSSTLPLENVLDMTQPNYTIQELTANTVYNVSLASMNNVHYPRLSNGVGTSLEYVISAFGSSLLIKTL